MIKHEIKAHMLILRIEPTLKQALEVAALKERRTVSDLVRLWLEKHLAKQVQPKKTIDG